LSAKKDAALVWLSEFSKLKLDKAGKTAALQPSKPLDISSRVGKPVNEENNGIQSGLLRQFIDGMGLTLPQLCQNYMTLCVRIGKTDRL
jgi:hypothetical protein